MLHKSLQPLITDYKDSDTTWELKMGMGVMGEWKSIYLSTVWVPEAFVLHQRVKQSKLRSIHSILITDLSYQPLISVYWSGFLCMWRLFY